ncbi:MAG: type I-B CRISPR-associated protein Cas7/Cst2/DevR [Thermosyntropha sp.]|nr:type I-B CRISPR-associated protein Cas7/Cst2/DevR [Thermosyntropha sp.]
MKDAKCLTISYLTWASYTSLNAGDKEADNITNLKKIQMNDGKEYPYCSSQAVRRALREQLAVLGCKLSEGVTAVQKKGAATTMCNPQEYIDDDLFGFMKADTATVKRISPVRVSPLIALEPYRGDLDYGTNYMAVKAGGDPNIFETEIHSGFYKGTILIELDRVGEKTAGDLYKLELEAKQKAERVKALLTAVQNLWTVGRQSRFLTDISPKFVCAALMKVKNPIFMESIRIEKGKPDINLINQTISDFAYVIIDHVIGERKGFFPEDNEQFATLGQAFDKMRQWIDDIFGEKTE